VSTWKVLLLYGIWLLAAAAIAIVAAILVGQIAGLFGVDAQEGRGRDVVFSVVAVGVFLVLAALPWLLRRRTAA
jgi:uncharacterized protein (DUF697 family)